MVENQNANVNGNDLEERILKFVQDVIRYANSLPKNLSNTEVATHLIKSSSAVGSNLIEANEAPNQRDYVACVKISRKEVKETRYWLNLCTADGQPRIKEALIQESEELLRIFDVLIGKLE